MLFFRPPPTNSIWKSLYRSRFCKAHQTAKFAQTDANYFSRSAASIACLMGNETKSNAAWDFWRKLGSPKYVVAPMVDGSELAFRELCRRYGAQLAYTPMLHSKFFANDRKYRAEYFTTNEHDRPVVAQFCANNPETFVAAARHLQHQVDAVDLNLGCPQGIARRGHYGSFLQDEWELLHRIVSTAVRELDVPVWVKIRVFDDKKRTVDYAQMLESAGASVIAVHGRTREQKGRDVPPADWGIIKAVREAVSVPVIANGNVRCLSDANRAISETGAAAVMSAWALLDNPATFFGDKAPSRLQLAREYIDLADRYKTPFRMVRLHLYKILRSRLDVNMDLNEPISRCKSFEDFRIVVQLLEHRCDFDGISFEQRLLSGNVPENVLSEKRIERMKRSQQVGTDKTDGLNGNRDNLQMEDSKLNQFTANSLS